MKTGGTPQSVCSPTTARIQALCFSKSFQCNGSFVRKRVSQYSRGWRTSVWRGACYKHYWEQELRMCGNTSKATTTIHLDKQKRTNDLLLRPGVGGWEKAGTYDTCILWPVGPLHFDIVWNNGSGWCVVRGTRCLLAPVSCITHTQHQQMETGG